MFIILLMHLPHSCLICLSWLSPRPPVRASRTSTLFCFSFYWCHLEWCLIHSWCFTDAFWATCSFEGLFHISLLAILHHWLRNTMMKLDQRDEPIEIYFNPWEGKSEYTPLLVMCHWCNFSTQSMFQTIIRHTTQIQEYTGK